MSFIHPLFLFYLRLYFLLPGQSLVCFSADPDRDWTPAFASLDDPFGFLHKLVRASDLTVCLDRYCAPDTSRNRQVQAFEVRALFWRASRQAASTAPRLFCLVLRQGFLIRLAGTISQSR